MSDYKSFEEALDDLKQIVDKFEKDKDISLDELINNYEQGLKAYNYCAKKLEDTEKKIKVIDEDYYS